MARKLINRLPSEGVWYVPEHGGNREEEDPIRVLLTPMSSAEMQRARELAATQGKGKRTGLFNMPVGAGRRLRDAVITRCVAEVEGLSTEDEEGREAKVTDGAGLLKAIDACLDPSQADLLDELIRVLQDGSALRESLGNE